MVHTDDADPDLRWSDRARRAAARAPFGEDANICVAPPEPAVPKKLLPRARSGRDPFPATFAAVVAASELTFESGVKLEGCRCLGGWETEENDDP